MRILKPVGEKLELDGNVYHLIFNLNVIDEIQENYDMPIVDAINSILDRKNKEAYNTLAHMLMVLINEDIRIYNKKNQEKKEEITLEYLREEIITNETSRYLSLMLLRAFNGTLVKNNEDNEDEDPNDQSVTTKK